MEKPVSASNPFSCIPLGNGGLWGGWQTCYSALGHAYRVWEPGLMPRIKDEWLDSVFYVYGTQTDAKSGTAVGGTGFLVSIPSTVEGHKHVYAVTNKHVAVRPPDGGAAHGPVLRLNTHPEGVDFLDAPAERWTPHLDGDDVCILAIELSDNHRYHTIDIKYFVERDDLGEYNIGPGDDVFMIGRFIGHEGRQTNTPSVRFGNISMMPTEPIRRPDGFMQESYAVEMRSLSGYSGSPVFMFWNYSFAEPGREKFAFSSALGLLGIDWGHIQSAKLHVYNGLDRKHPDGLYVRGNTAMTGVVPAWKLLEVLNLGQFVAARAERDRELLALAALDPPPSEYD